MIVTSSDRPMITPCPLRHIDALFIASVWPIAYSKGLTANPWTVPSPIIAATLEPATALSGLLRNRCKNARRGKVSSFSNNDILSMMCANDMVPKAFVASSRIVAHSGCVSRASLAAIKAVCAPPGTPAPNWLHGRSLPSEARDFVAINLSFTRCSMSSMPMGLKPSLALVWVGVFDKNTYLRFTKRSLTSGWNIGQPSLLSLLCIFKNSVMSLADCSELRASALYMAGESPVRPDAAESSRRRIVWMTSSVLHSG